MFRLFSSPSYQRQTQTVVTMPLKTSKTMSHNAMLRNPRAVRLTCALTLTLGVVSGLSLLTASAQQADPFGAPPPNALPAQPIADPQPAPPVDPDAANPVVDQPGEVLTRGPVHEAFAQPLELERAEPPTVPKAPPAAIDEIPPEDKPVGENILWIPGYFAWDEDRKDFVWISGIYRETPPGQTWVGGYWREVPGGQQWVSGFWTSAQQSEVEFLPQPPNNLDNGPNAPQPSDDHFWIAGNWRYQDNRYAWQAGYWSRSQTNWIWSPARYVWSPNGWIYCPGFWDVTLPERGLCYAPVYFAPTVWTQPHFAYTPRICLRPNFMTVHLWSRPRYGSYYFGDYYGGGYLAAGYRPWFQPLIANRNYYDPLFSYYSWQGRRHDPRWNDSIRHRHDLYVNNPGYRPPHTYLDLQQNLVQQPQLQQIVNNVNVVNSPNTIVDLTNVQGINNVAALDPQNTRGPGRPLAPGLAEKQTVELASLQVQNAALVADVGKVAALQRTATNPAFQLEKIPQATRQKYARQAGQQQAIVEQRRKLAIDPNLATINPNATNANLDNPAVANPNRANPLIGDPPGKNPNAANPAIPNLGKNGPGNPAANGKSPPVAGNSQRGPGRPLSPSATRLKLTPIDPVQTAGNPNLNPDTTPNGNATLPNTVPNTTPNNPALSGKTAVNGNGNAAGKGRVPTNPAPSQSRTVPPNPTLDNPAAKLGTPNTLNPRAGRRPNLGNPALPNTVGPNNPANNVAPNVTGQAVPRVTNPAVPTPNATANPIPLPRNNSGRPLNPNLPQRLPRPNDPVTPNLNDGNSGRSGGGKQALSIPSTPPAPKTTAPTPSPRINNPAPTISPRLNNSTPSPRFNNPTPNPNPTVSPRINLPSPSARINSPAPTISPRVNTPSVSPRINNAPAVSPRVNRPTPSPRISQPQPRINNPAPSMSRPTNVNPSPRASNPSSGGGGGRSGRPLSDSAKKNKNN